MVSKSLVVSTVKNLIFVIVAVIIIIFSGFLGYKFAKNYFSDLENSYFQIVDDINQRISDFEDDLIYILR